MVQSLQQTKVADRSSAQGSGVKVVRSKEMINCSRRLEVQSKKYWQYSS